MGFLKLEFCASFPATARFGMCVSVPGRLLVRGALLTMLHGVATNVSLLRVTSFVYFFYSYFAGSDISGVMKKQL